MLLHYQYSYSYLRHLHSEASLPGPLAEAFLRNLCKTSLSRREGGNLECIYSRFWLSTQYYSTPCPFPLFCPTPQVRKIVRAFCSGLPTVTQPPCLLIHLTPNQCCSIGKMERGNRRFSSLASCLYYGSKWLKALLLHFGLLSSATPTSGSSAPAQLSSSQMLPLTFPPTLF